ncbi:MAG: indolepyruvate ferredoxin oxidoreductase subunit alpha, partial [Candidatus Aenigmatarchaeota archaeon]
ENKKIVLLGNEAIARGALEAGVGLVACYPGTPSSEIGNALASIAKDAKIYFEWSTNEKVAFEVAAGAAFCGVKALTAVKHFGLNVALDSLLPVVYTGVNAGLVYVVADDPHGWSSAQSEQDTRWVGRMGNIPMLEPSNPQEAKDFTIEAFKLSEKYQIPVILHTTTKVNHAIGTVELKNIPKNIKTKGNFEKNFEKYYNITPGIQKQHENVLKKLEEIEKEYENFNIETGKENSKIGIITSGVCYEYLMEKEIYNYAKIAKLNIIYPFPKKFISKFIKNLDVVIVVEQLEPFIEEYVRQIAKDVNPKLKIYGKDLFPRIDELETDLIYSKIAPILNIKIKDWNKEDELIKKMKIPTRKPALCPGCPHRSTFFAIREIVDKDTPMPGDIGCYILGIYEPFKTQDFDISMGASTGFAHGFYKVGAKRPVVFIGDSTFFHAAIPGIINMKYNNSAPIVIILDNSITAMTGHQPNPGTGINSFGPTDKIKIEDIVKAIGIKNVEIANTWNQKELQEKMKKLWKSNELGVLIARGECRLLMRRRILSQGKDFVKFQINQEKCTKCGICIDKFACPAIQRDENGKKYWIDTSLCWGCSVCSQICPAKAIKAFQGERK